MLLSSKIIKMLCDQITHENNNEMKYRAVQAYFEDLQLHGFSKYFETQALSEYGHRNHIINYMNDKNAHITYETVQPYTQPFKTDKDIVDFYYATEIGTTQKLYAIVKQAESEGDFGTVDWLYHAPITDGGASLILEQIE